MSLTSARQTIQKECPIRRLTSTIKETTDLGPAGPASERIRLHSNRGGSHAGPIAETRRDPVSPERSRGRSTLWRSYRSAPEPYYEAPEDLDVGDDVHGDCVTAEEAFAKACNNPEIFISDAEVIAWATKHGVLEGASLTQVMTWMQSDGFVDGSVVYDDGPYFSVGWTNAGTLQSAISSGPVKIGVAADQIENAWRTTGGQWRPVGVVRNGISRRQQRRSLRHAVRLWISVLAGTTA